MRTKIGITRTHQKLYTWCYICVRFRQLFEFFCFYLNVEQFSILILAILSAHQGYIKSFYRSYDERTKEHNKKKKQNEGKSMFYALFLLLLAKWIFNSRIRIKTIKIAANMILTVDPIESFMLLPSFFLRVYVSLSKPYLRSACFCSFNNVEGVDVKAIWKGTFV